MFLGFVASSIQEPRKEVELRISFILNTKPTWAHPVLPKCRLVGQQEVKAEDLKKMHF